jgi:U3 small nucleolar RNA-associated protein 12
LIQKFDGHHAEVWALAASNRGEFVVTGSHDKSIRVFEKTDEPLFLEEEREREMEQLYDTNLANELTQGEGDEDGGVEAEAVQKTTAESMMAGERIMEAIELADADRATMKQYEEEKKKMGEMGASLPKPTRHPELATKGDITAVAFVMGILRKIPAANMEDALLVLPFRQVVSLLAYLDEWALAVSLPCTTIVSKTVLTRPEPRHNPSLSTTLLFTPDTRFANHFITYPTPTTHSTPSTSPHSSR